MRALIIDSIFISVVMMVLNGQALLAEAIEPLIRRGHSYSYVESAAASPAAASLPAPSSVLDPGGFSLPEVPRP
jgi:hypothetical protein